MTAIPKCATCGRKPSERYGVHVLLVRVWYQRNIGRCHHCGMAAR